MEDKEDIQNFKDYWKLVNLLDEMCCTAIEEGDLYGDDVISALDRVKMNWLEDKIKYQVEADQEAQKKGVDRDLNFNSNKNEGEEA